MARCLCLWRSPYPARSSCLTSNTGISWDVKKGEWEEAEPRFRDAHRRADIVLAPAHLVKEKIAQCLVTRSYISECPGCLL